MASAPAPVPATPKGLQPGDTTSAPAMVPATPKGLQPGDMSGLQPGDTIALWHMSQGVYLGLVSAVDMMDSRSILRTDIGFCRGTVLWALVKCLCICIYIESLSFGLTRKVDCRWGAAWDPFPRGN